MKNKCSAIFGTLLLVVGLLSAARVQAGGAADLLRALQTMQQQQQQQQASSDTDTDNAWQQVGVAAIQQTEQYKNSRQCMDQCVDQLRSRLLPGQTRRCKDDGACRTCLSQC